MSEHVLYFFAESFLRALSVAVPASAVILILLFFTRLSGMKYKMNSYCLLYTLVVLRLTLPFSPDFFHHYVMFLSKHHRQ